MSELKYWLGFNLVKGIGPAKIQALLDFYGDLSAAWKADERQLAQLGIDRRTIKAFRETRQTMDLDEYLGKVHSSGTNVLTWQSDGYPRYLREVAAPPPVLYVAGEIKEADEWAVAVVGTRRLSPYGRQVTHELVSDLVRSNITVVSGLALGIDGVAHETALKNGGRTLAVLGSGIDCLYPPQHRELARRIVREKQGAVISDYPMGTQPDAKNFPPRNRIISGLSLGVIVVEAGGRSGALITANFALEQNREVFAVPGPITQRTSVGTNRLIQQGAKLVSSVEDVLEELNLTMVPQQIAVKQVAPDTKEEAALLDHLSPEPVHVDDLCRATGLDTAKVSSTLTMMELKGMVQQVGGMRYVLIREAGAVYDVGD